MMSGKFERIWLTCKAGIVTGLLLGHIDALVRVFHMSFEWFEFYQALLVPGVVLAFLFGVGAVLFEIWISLRRKEVDLVAFRYALCLLVGIFPFCTVIWIFLQYFVVGDLKSIRVVPDTAAILFLITLVAAAAAIALIRKWVSPERLQSATARYVSPWNSYLVFVLAFCLSMFVYDACEYFGIKPVSSATDQSVRAGGKPNVILITLDTLRADHLSFYGYPKDTAPFLSNLASSSVLFSHAISTAPWTLPAHASLFTGKYVYHHGAHLTHQQLSFDQDTLAEVLGRSGYRTGGFVAGPYCKAKYGLAQGFEIYRDRMDFIEYRHTQDWASLMRLLSFFSIDFRNWLLGVDGEVSAPEINRQALQWIDSISDEPFFLFLNYFDVHDPYNRGDEYLHLFTTERRDWKPIELMLLQFSEDPALRYKYLQVDEDFREYLIALYDAEIRYLDAYLKKLFQELRDRALLDNTMVIITSDHGDEFFDHGGVLHMQTLYQEMIHVPLMVYYPRLFSPSVRDELVGITDIFATVLEVLGLNVEELPSDSQSFFSNLRGNEDLQQRQGVVSERYVRDPSFESQQTAITGNKWKYIQVEPERERIFNALFDLDEDPMEEKNLIQEDEGTDLTIALNELSAEVDNIRNQNEVEQ